MPLVASRAAQGAGAAFAAPAALSILTGTFAEGAPRTRALAIFGATGAAAAPIGQVVGGLLTTGPGWEWVFLVNVPVGAGLIALALVQLPPAPPRRQRAGRRAGRGIDRDHLDHAYALTVHREQGATSDRAHVLAEGGGRQLAYVALSRARHRTTVHTIADDSEQPIEKITND